MTDCGNYDTALASIKEAIAKYGSMRRISFAFTKRQIREQTKTVTRRNGWKSLKPGTLLLGVEKAMGLKPGERMVPLAVIRVVDVRRERVDAISSEDCAREGFPEKAPADFVALFLGMYRDLKPSDLLTRIEFEYVEMFQGPPMQQALFGQEANHEHR